MATKKPAKRTTTTTTVEEPDEREELDAFDRARLEFSGEPGVKLTVYRYDDGETSYLKRVPYDHTAIDEEWIRKRWGAGAYQLRFTDEEGARRWSKVVHIAADVPSSASSTSSNTGETAFLETLRRQNEIMLQSLLSRATAPAAASSGGTEAIVALIQGLQAQNAELLKATINRPDVSSTILQVLERGMSIAADHQLEAEGGWMAQAARIAKELLPTLSEISRARAAQFRPVGGAPGFPTGLPPGAGPTPGGRPTPVPATAPVNGTPNPPNPSTQETVDLDEIIRSFSPSILEAIGNGVAPEDVADNILAYIPPAFYDAFQELTPDRAVRCAPALSQHRTYIEKLVASLREANDEGSDS